MVKSQCVWQGAKTQNVWHCSHFSLTESTSETLESPPRRGEARTYLLDLLRSGGEGGKGPGRACSAFPPCTGIIMSTMMAMCHFSILLSLLPPLHAFETGKMDIVLATNRPLAAAATLNSVCSNTHDTTQLVFHVIVPDDEEVLLSSETRLACSGASFVDWTLSKIESTVVEIRGRLPLWSDPRLMSVNQEKTFPFSVPVADNQLDPKHKSPFNLVRFYMPEILRARGIETALLLDDDVIVQEDLRRLWSRAAFAQEKPSLQAANIGASRSRGTASKNQSSSRT